MTKHSMKMTKVFIQIVENRKTHEPLTDLFEIGENDITHFCQFSQNF